jgi:anti-sigma factor RsiW
MNCRTAQKMLHRYRAGELTDRQRRRLDRHLTDCDHCGHVAARLQALEAEVADLRSAAPVEPAPDVLTDAIMAQVAAEPHRAPRRGNHQPRVRRGPVPGWLTARPVLTMALAVLVLALGIQEVSLMQRLDRLERRMAESGGVQRVTDPSAARLEASGAARIALPGGSGLAGEMLDSGGEADLVLVKRSDLERLLASIYPGADTATLKALLVRHFPELGTIDLADGITRREARRLLAHRTEILDVLRGL